MSKFITCPFPQQALKIPTDTKETPFKYIWQRAWLRKREQILKDIFGDQIKTVIQSDMSEEEERNSSVLSFCDWVNCADTKWVKNNSEDSGVEWEETQLSRGG